MADAVERSVSGKYPSPVYPTYSIDDGRRCGKISLGEISIPSLSDILNRRWQTLWKDQSRGNIHPQSIRHTQSTMADAVERSVSGKYPSPVYPTYSIDDGRRCG